MLRTMLAVYCFSAAAALHASALPRLAVRTSTPAMNFFSELSKGITKLQAGDYDEAAVRARVQQMIDRKPCVVFATTTCPFCNQVDDILTNMGAVHTRFDFDQVCARVCVR